MVDIDKFSGLYATAKKSGVFKFPASEKFYLLNYIKAISNSGQDEKLAINNKIEEYSKRNKPFLALTLRSVKEEIDRGKKFAIALKNAGLLTEREYHILVNSKGGMSQGIDKIIETNKKSSKSMAAFMLLFLPPSIMLLALLFGHDAVKGVLNNMLAPIRDSGGTPPPIPEYLMDPSTYIFFNVLYFTILFGAIFGMVMIKKFMPKKYLRIIPIIEEEYMLDILKSIKTVTMGGGINMANAAKALASGEPNNIKRLLLEKIVERTSFGKERISEVFEEFGANYNTVSSLKIGEDSNNINIGLDIALDDLESRYERDIKTFLKIGMWGGQLGMIGIAGKPLIDIMLLMSVGQLNFQV
jgi:type II secretory pathway component PulF